MTKTILKIQNSTVFQTEKLPEIKRISGFIDKNAFIKLQSILSIDSNPRQPKQSAVTNEIHDSLSTSSESFHLLTKGILYSALECNALERSRFQISFEENDHAATGILDGGHNTFAIGKYLLSHVIPDKELKSIKDWSSYVEKWNEYVDVLGQADEIKDFLVPVEFIVPSNQSADSLFTWSSLISDITHARNNNLQLTDTTKANFQGVYDKIKEYLPEDLKEKIEWKTNDGGKIKAQQVIPLLLIPLSKIPQEILGYKLNDNDLMKIYSSKGSSVKLVHELMGKNGKYDASRFILENTAVESAIKMLPEIIKGYDKLYCEIPDAYNKSGGSFGRIESVRIYDPAGSKKRHSKSTFRSKFFDQETTFDVPEGFMIPILTAMSSLIKYDKENNQLRWLVSEPSEYLSKNLKGLMNQFTLVIKVSNYDPQKVGKLVESYRMSIDKMSDIVQIDSRI